MKLEFGNLDHIELVRSQRKPPKSPITWSLMDSMDIRAIRALQRVSMVQGIWHKPFSISLYQQLQQTRKISGKQKYRLWKLVYAYRKQMQQKLVDVAQLFLEENGGV